MRHKNRSAAVARPRNTCPRRRRQGTLSRMRISMSSSSLHQPDSSGSFSQEIAPRIVVRAGKHCVCTACGTLVELPEDVTGQWVWVAAETSSAEPASEEPKPENSAAKSNPFKLHATELSGHAATGRANASRRSSSRNEAWGTPSRPLASPHSPSPSRPQRPKSPRRNTFVGSIIDGLRVPSGAELDRALAWVSFHLKVLDRQGEEIQRLKKQLKLRRTPSQHDAQQTLECHAHTDAGMSPATAKPKGRAPP